MIRGTVSSLAAYAQDDRRPDTFGQTGQPLIHTVQTTMHEEPMSSTQTRTVFV